MTVGDRIKLQREIKGMSQLELAQKVGYATKGTISRIESGKHDLSIDKVKEIAEVLGVTPHYLMGWSASPLTIKTDLELTEEALNGLTPDQLARVRTYIEFIKFEDKK